MSLERLVAALAAGRATRLVARPGWVTALGVRGGGPVEVVWDEAAHAAALASLPAPQKLEGGVTAAAVGGSIVLRRPPDPARTIDALIEDGWLSQLAGRTLSEAAGLGRNILIAGPHAPAVELVAALIAGGARPAVVGVPGDAVPPSWPLLGSPDETYVYGADRIGAWSLDPAALAALLQRASGVVGFLDARRLDRALMRFEAAGTGGGPLRVLASLDLVVVLQAHESPRVQLVAEIDLAEDGYRPRPLFSTGLPPVATALVPVSAPSFTDELEQAGQRLLADDLRHASPPARGAPAVRREEPAPGRDEPEPPPARPRRPVVAEVPEVPAPRLDHLREDAPPPGWELDQLSDEEVRGDDAGTADPDSATMAATYGLAPPPRPTGLRAVSPEVAAYEGTFKDALERAKQRQAELEDEDEGRGPEA